MADNLHENFSPQESLQVIQSMISKTKANISENSFSFLLWGWLAFFTFLGQYILKAVFEYRHFYVVALIMFIGIPVNIIYNRRRTHKYARTYVGDSIRYLWTGLGVCFVILNFLFANIPQGWLFCYPFFILLYGLGTFVSGMILKFKPLVAGGIINWILAVIAIRFEFNTQILFALAAVVICYIVPGYLIRPKSA
jgi:hypothetical protein